MSTKEEMSHGERVRAAIDLKEPDRVPAFCTLSWAVNLAGNNLNCIGKKEKDVSMPQFLNTPAIQAEAHFKATELFDADFVWCYSSNQPVAVALGCETNQPYWSTTAISRTAIDKVEYWKNLEFPNIEKDPTTSKQLDTIRLVEKGLHEKRGNDTFIDGLTNGPFTIAGLVLGIEKLMFAMVDRPDDTKEFIDFYTDVAIEVAKAQLDAGADQIFCPDPSASGDLIPPDFYKEFALPYAQKYCKAIVGHKDRYSCMYHICGDTADRLEDLASIGVSFLSLDYKVSMKEAKERIGDKVCLCGNVNPAETLFLGTPEKIEEEGRQCIRDAAPGGGYIYWSGCDLPIDCSLKNVKAFMEVPIKYGKYPIN
ncbi:TPA: hypothetical protein HA351_08455 [Methanosarcinaceae archaeon]|nr:hypothetical protein [Methanosarcinaceae archaeon]